MSRVPLHAATFENFTLFPLQNGKSISNLIVENIQSEKVNIDLIGRIFKLIELG